MLRVALLLTLAFSTQLLAAPREVRTLTELVGHSDLIVSGEVIDVEVAGNVVSLRLLPRRLLKGELDTQTVHAYVVTNPGTLSDTARDALRGKFALLFLNYDREQERWRLNSDGHILLPHHMILAAEDPGKLMEEESAGTPLQRVIMEVASFYAKGPSHSALTLLIPLSWQRVEPELTESVFRAFLSSEIPEVQETGLSGLANVGSPAAVMAISERMSALSKPRVEALLAMLARSYTAVGDDALNLLIGWLGTDRVEFRSGAAGVLARLRHPVAVVALGRALFDSEFEVRWRAIGGLAVFANNIDIASGVPEGNSWKWRTDDTMKHSVFDRQLVQTNESLYLGFWRGWWTEHEQQVTSLVGGQ